MRKLLLLLAVFFVSCGEPARESAGSEPILEKETPPISDSAKNTQPSAGIAKTRTAIPYLDKETGTEVGKHWTIRVLYHGFEIKLLDDTYYIGYYEDGIDSGKWIYRNGYLAFKSQYGLRLYRKDPELSDTFNKIRLRSVDPADDYTFYNRDIQPENGETIDIGGHAVIVRMNQEREVTGPLFERPDGNSEKAVDGGGGEARFDADDYTVIYSIGQLISDLRWRLYVIDIWYMESGVYFGDRYAGTTIYCWKFVE